MENGLARDDILGRRRWRGLRGRWRSVIAFVVIALVAAVFGCSSSPGATAKRCGTSPACGPGAACIDDGSGSGPACQLVCTDPSQCPVNTYCNDGLASGQLANWCAPSTYPVSQKLPGQWGDSCKSGCDTSDGFYCYGVLPTDANAFCSLAGCIGDADCPGGWWCATVNATPNHTTSVRTFGPTQSWCLPRQYCATCKMDHDCSKAADGTQQHCVQDSAGNGFCAPQCGSNAACPLDAACQLKWGVCAQAACKKESDCAVAAEHCTSGLCQLACTKDSDCPPANGAPQHCSGRVCVAQSCASDDDCPPTAGTFQHCNAGACAPECSTAADCNPSAGDQACVPLSVCVPRAGVCVGNHKLCSPCRSDADCTGGFCVNAQYSTERFCSAAMSGTATCSSTAPPSVADCPLLPTGIPATGFGCTTSADTSLAPANQCIGEVSLGSSQGVAQYVAGCWSVHQ